jgi:hypothetical protein
MSTCLRLAITETEEVIEAEYVSRQSGWGRLYDFNSHKRQNHNGGYALKHVIM